MATATKAKAAKVNPLDECKFVKVLSATGPSVLKNRAAIIGRLTASAAFRDLEIRRSDILELEMKIEQHIDLSVNTSYSLKPAPDAGNPFNGAKWWTDYVEMKTTLKVKTEDLEVAEAAYKEIFGIVNPSIDAVLSEE